MKKEISPELIKKYLAGECSPEELRLVNRWYNSFENEEGLISSLDEQQQLDLKSKMLSKVKKNIHQQKKITATTKVDRNLSNRFALYAKIAAMTVIVAGLSFFIINYSTINNPDTKQEMLVNTRETVREIANHQVDSKKISLPDGSTIWLSANSTIKHPANFETHIREVYLDGEAFFDVKRDTLRPFIIHSGHLTTRVLGTSFTIRAYQQDPRIEVSVVTGKVSVYVKPEAETKVAKDENKASPQIDSKAGELVLLPNEKATFSKINLALQREPIEPLPKKNRWAPASLSFQNTSIRQVVKELNQQFDAEILIEDQAINNCTIRADFTNQNLPLIIELICKSIDADYRMIDKKIVISGEGCSTH
jgi:ferric-dicitrate binding protein FerR (iron transport regulator)